MGSMRFLADEHVPQAVVRALRERGVDIVRVQECGLGGASDTAILSRAFAEGLVVVTRDADFLRLHAAGTRHAGLVYAPHSSGVGAVVCGVVLIAQILSPDDMRGHVEYV